MFPNGFSNPRSEPPIALNHRPLQPSSGSALNVQLEPDPSRKRKRCENIETSKPEEHIIIQPHSSSPSATPLCLKTRIVIPRSSLYLQLLNGPLTEHIYIGARLFCGKIESLIRNSIGQQDNAESQILVAEDDHGLYAIEKVAEGLYTLSGFSHRVKIDGLSKLPPTSGRALKRRKDGHPMGAQWWKAVAVSLSEDEEVDLCTSQAYKDYSGFRIPMQPPGWSVANGLAGDSLQQPSARDAGAATIEENPFVFVEAGAPNQDLCLEELKNNIRAQYQESLYLSKISLAYFTKGPLSRARATASQDTASSQMVLELSEFLRSSLLSRQMTEAKYSNTIPSMVQDIPVGLISDDEELITALGDTLRKSRKRKKLAKNGLLPGEEEYVAKWFINRERAQLIDETYSTKAERIKSFLVEVRVRETQIQLILILEILLLEALAAGYPVNIEPQSSDETEKAESQGKPTKRRQKPLDLQVMMEMLIERLCIWQSTSEGQTKMTTSEAIEMHDGIKDTLSISHDNQLKEFCTEVVVPFYAARLPEACSSICQKLGGPGANSPARPLLTKASSSSKVPPKSSTVLQEHKRPKPQRTLKRLLTDEKRASRRPTQGLTRSTTDSALMGIKRESSDVSLSNIPVAKGRSQIPKQYSQREVDLAAASKATEAKLQRKRAFEQDLKGAIAALRRPNPRLAVKDFVDSADRRASVTGSRSRKSKNPVRNPFAQDVQVLATPHATRTRDVFEDLLRPLHFRNDSANDQRECIPPSSDLCIPSSSRRSQASTFMSGSQFSKSTSTIPPLWRQHEAQIIQKTPTKRPSKLGRPLTIGGLESGWSASGTTRHETSPYLPDIPLPTSSEYLFKRLTGSTALTAPQPPCTPSRRKSLPEARIAATPVMDRRRDDVATAIQNTPLAPRRNSLGGEMVSPSVPLESRKALGPLSSLGAGASPLQKHTRLEEEDLARPKTVIGLSAQTDIYKVLGWDDDYDL